MCVTQHAPEPLPLLMFRFETMSWCRCCGVSPSFAIFSTGLRRSSHTFACVAWQCRTAWDWTMRARVCSDKSGTQDEGSRRVGASSFIYDFSDGICSYPFICCVVKTMRLVCLLTLDHEEPCPILHDGQIYIGKDGSGFYFSLWGVRGVTASTARLCWICNSVHL